MLNFRCIPFRNKIMIGVLNMKTKTKKLLSTLLALVLVLSAVPFAGFGAGAIEIEGDYRFSTYNGTAMITDYAGDSAEVIIPETLGGCTVTRIYENAFRNCKNVTSITIPATVKAIDREAFYNASDIITTIKFAENSQLETIGKSAFFGLRGLTSITIPASVTDIGFEAFGACAGLTAINVEAGNTKYVSSDGVLFNIDKTQLIQYPASKDATSYTIPASVKKIETYAFSSSSNLSVVNFEENNALEDMGDYIFGGCKSLKSVTIPKGVTEIGLIPFGGCVSLESINVEQGNKKYFSVDGVLMSTDKEGISLVKYPEGKKDTSYTVPANVNNINYGAFVECENLVALDCEANSQLETIGSEAFEACYALTSVSLPKSLTSLEGAVFLGCRALKTVEFEEGCRLEAINGYTFYECKKLEKITVPASVKSIGMFAFGACAKLSTIDFEKGSQLKKISTQAFYESAITSITIPASVSEIGTYAFSRCYNLTAATFEKDNSLEKIENSAFNDRSNALVIYGYTGKYEEKYANENDIPFYALDAVHVHRDEVQSEKRATCTADGEITYKCYCGHTHTEVVPATGHNYVDGVCGNCGDVITKACSCSCHKTGFSGFFWKIKLIFYRIFGTNEVCECGVAHY